MVEWWVEEGITEHRAILTDGGTIRAARVCWLDPVRAGAIFSARIVNKPRGARRGTAVLDNGRPVLVDALTDSVTEGAELLLRITRAAMAETGRHKLAQARPAPNGALPGPAPTLAGRLRESGRPVKLCRAEDARLAALGWDELVEEAASGEVPFTSGMLTISPTPAMTVIDIDGALPARQLALGAVPAIAAALARLDIAGSVGIDFPTLAERKDRQAIDAALAEALAGQAGERTAMNGFGFVQWVTRLEGPSLVQLYQRHPARLAVATLERRVLAQREPGSLEITLHPALEQALPQGFADALAARTGRQLVWNASAAIALDTPIVQTLAP